MKKTWQLRACAVYLTLGASVAASCAREADTHDDDGSGDTGGSTTKAGSSSSTAGTKSAFGGTSAKAGAGSGGKGGTTSQGGMTSAGGTAGAGGGTGGTAGAGGSTGVPPDVLERASAIVYYQTSEVTASTGTIQMKLNIVNQADDPLPMTNVKIRYWATAEKTPQLIQYYTGPEARPPSAVFVSDGANSHALMTFGGGSIAKGGDFNASEVQLVMTTNNMGNFNQADDFSWQPTSTTSMPNGNIALYLDDKLIWGCEPSGTCFDDGGGMGGAGAGGGPGTDGAGAGGAPSAGGAPDTGGAPDAGGAPGAGGIP